MTTAVVASVVGARTAHFLSAKTLSVSLGSVMILSIPVILTRSPRERDSVEERSGLPKVEDGIEKLRLQIKEVKERSMVENQSIMKEYLTRNWYLLATGAITGFASGALGIGLIVFIALCLYHVLFNL